MKLGAVLLVGVMMLTACGGGTNGKGSTASRPSTPTVAPTTAAPATSEQPSEPSAPATPGLVERGFTQVAGADESPLFVRPGKPHTISYLDGNQPQLLVGYPIAFATEDSNTVIDPSQFILGAHGIELVNGDLSASVIARACGATPTIAAAAKRAGLPEDEELSGLASTAYDVPAGQEPITACWVFEQDYSSTLGGLYYVSHDEAESGDDPAPSDILVRSRHFTPPKAAKPKPPPRMTLEITGNGSTSNVITWSLGTSIEQATDASIPWARNVSAAFDFYQVSAQDGDGTSITCKIIDTDGKVLDQHTSTGLYAIASCSAST